MHERQSIQWQDLNRARRPKILASHAYGLEGGWEPAGKPPAPAGRTRRLLIALGAALPLMLCGLIALWGG